MKIRNHRNTIIFLLILIIIFPILFYARDLSSSSFLKHKTYVSNSLNFTINIPSNFEVNDTGITLALKNNQGEISIIRNGTQHKDLNSYLSDQDLDSSYSVTSVTKMKINGLNTIARIESTGDKALSLYYIYVLNAVYIISSSDTELYDDLGEIAKSFKYTGK